MVSLSCTHMILHTSDYKLLKPGST